MPVFPLIPVALDPSPSDESALRLAGARLARRESRSASCTSSRPPLQETRW
ncbi:hypothetical protein ACH3VS_36230 [Streptomyces sp. WSLK1-3]|uniref:hypothetical protein n=1 Tax=Streptomyces sp. WSLK1-3 TaxID=3375475 RepID=UPI0037945FB3